MAELRFDDRVAVITGAGRGLGRAYALLLASRGAKVVVNDLGAGLQGEGADAGPAADVVREIRAAGGQAVACTDSVATPQGGQAIIDTALEHYGRVDIQRPTRITKRCDMLLERSEIQVKSGGEASFASAISERGLPLLLKIPGVRSATFGRGVENPGKFIFLVEWTSLEAHEAFRTHASYPEFMQLFAPYAEGGVMEHFQIQ